MKHRGPVALMLLIVICLFTLLWPLQGITERKFIEAYPSRVETSKQIELPTGLHGVFRFLQLAGLHSLLADVLWMKADDLWHSSSWFEMAPVMEAIVELDPHFIMVWRVLAWHYGWNLHTAALTSSEKVHWLDKSAETYEEGTRLNPEDYDLWWDMCFFYKDRVRQNDKAEEKLRLGVEKFPDNDLTINTIERNLQRVYELTWRIDDAKAVIEDILKKRPDDALAKRDLEWWNRIGKDENYRWVIEWKENQIRDSRDLSAFRNPFEGTIVDSPPWRDWNAPYYADPDWKPDLSKYALQTVSPILQERPDLTKDWFAAHPTLSEEDFWIAVNKKPMPPQQGRRMMERSGRIPGGPGSRMPVGPGARMPGGPGSAGAPPPVESHEGHSH